MKAGGGRNKGNAFERHIATEVVMAFSCLGIGKRDAYRTPLSGGHIFAKEEDPGDLVISKKLRKYFPFHCECKAYKKVDLSALFTPIDRQVRAKKFRPWVEQVTKAARRGQHPVIIFKQNNGPVLALLPQLMPLVAKIKIRFKTSYKREPWYCVRFADMLKELVRQAKEHEQ